MSHILAEIGYRVRSAENGFSALRELRQEIPGILVSDLNMPGMSGFELLSIVRRRFPAIQTIAMSGSFSGDEVPSGVAADAFYQKGSSIGALLRIMESLPHPDRVLAKQPAAPVPLWIQYDGHNTSGDACVTIVCPECLRTFSQVVGSSLCLVRETDCIHCGSSIHYGIVQPAERDPAQFFQRPSRGAQPAGLPQYDY